MSGTIYKFEREMLKGEDIHIRKKSDNAYYKKHWHNYFEIIYYKNCAGYCSLNGMEYPLRGNCLFFLTPSDFHQIVTEEVPDSYALIISFSEQIADKKILEKLTGEAIVLYDLPPLLAGQIEELYTVFSGKSAFRERYLHHLLNCILICILEQGQRVLPAAKDIHPIVRESIAYMLANPSAPITLHTFAEKFCITEAYFSHLFHENAGVSFKQYLTSLRMECAKRMLSEGEFSVIDVGFECGFVSPSQFSRSFKKHTGMTPSEYRAKKNSAAGMTG